MAAKVPVPASAFPPSYSTKTRASLFSGVVCDVYADRYVSVPPTAFTPAYSNPVHPGYSASNADANKDDNDSNREGRARLQRGDQPLGVDEDYMGTFQSYGLS